MVDLSLYTRAVILINIRIYSNPCFIKPIVAFFNVHFFNQAQTISHNKLFVCWSYKISVNFRIWFLCHDSLIKYFCRIGNIQVMVWNLPEKMFAGSLHSLFWFATDFLTFKFQSTGSNFAIKTQHSKILYFVDFAPL